MTAHAHHREKLSLCPVNPELPAGMAAGFPHADLVQVAHSLVGAEREGCGGETTYSSDGFPSIDVYIALLELGFCYDVKGR